ncbi:hypothetical protein IWX50DRAFT_138483 [Phyllosticta citricarpa]
MAWCISLECSLDSQYRQPSSANSPSGSHGHEYIQTRVPIGSLPTSACRASCQPSPPTSAVAASRGKEPTSTVGSRSPPNIVAPCLAWLALKQRHAQRKAEDPRMVPLAWRPTFSPRIFGRGNTGMQLLRTIDSPDWSPSPGVPNDMMRKCGTHGSSEEEQRSWTSVKGRQEERTWSNCQKFRKDRDLAKDGSDGKHVNMPTRENVMRHTPLS